MPGVRACQGWKVRTVKTREFVYTSTRATRGGLRVDEDRYAYTFEECDHTRISDYYMPEGSKQRCYACGPSHAEIRERRGRMR